jgi:hypothetical protein
MIRCSFTFGTGAKVGGREQPILIAVINEIDKAETASVGRIGGKGVKAAKPIVNEAFQRNGKSVEIRI